MVNGPAGDPSPTPSPAPTPPPPAPPRWYREPSIAIPLAIALIALLFGDAIASNTIVAWEEGNYANAADEACSPYAEQLNSLGPEPWKQQGPTFQDWMKGRKQIMVGGLASWHDVDIPFLVDDRAKEAWLAADIAVGYFARAVDWQEQGNEENAKHFLEYYENAANDAAFKAKNLGLEKCPVGILGTSGQVAESAPGST